MSRRHTVHPRTLAQWAVVVAAIVALGVAVSAVRSNAPGEPLDPISTAAPDVDDPELATCERTLPEAPDENIAQVDPVGRVSSSAVMECPNAFDGHVVVFLGEVVGDVLQRDGGAWVLVNDDSYALELGPLQAHNTFAGTNSGLSVWLPAPLPDLDPGRADRRGTVVRVEGVIRRADPADGGGLTVRALGPDSTTIIAEAVEIERPVNVGQVVLAVVLVVVAGGVALVERRSRQRR